MDNVEQRLAQLERRNRWLWAGLSFGVGIIGVAALAIAVGVTLLTLNAEWGAGADTKPNGDSGSENEYAQDERTDGERDPLPQAESRRDLPLPEFQYSFTNEPFVNPRVINEFLTWLSDWGDQVVAINLLDAQESNRYFCTVEQWDNEQIGALWGANPSVRYEKEGERGPVRFSYRYIGLTDSGVHVLVTTENSGGSLTSTNLLFLTVESDMGIPHDWDWDHQVIRQTRPRLLLRCLGSIALGDRWFGRLQLDGNRLLVGTDEGWFSDRPGDAESSEDPEERVIVIEL